MSTASGSTLSVVVNRDRLNDLTAPDEFTAAGSFAVEFTNEGESLHVHVRPEGQLAEVASVPASNQYVEGGTRSRVPVNVRQVSGPVSGELVVVTGHGTESKRVAVTVTPAADAGASGQTPASDGPPQASDASSGSDAGPARDGDAATNAEASDGGDGSASGSRATTGRADGPSKLGGNGTNGGVSELLADPSGLLTVALVGGALVLALVVQVTLQNLVVTVGVAALLVAVGVAGWILLTG